MSNYRSSRKSILLQACARPVLELLEGRTLFNAGDFDGTFGVNATATPMFAAPHSYAYPASVLVQHDGKPVVVGTAGPVSNSGTPNQDFALTRLTTAGALDTTFGTHGVVFTDFNGGDDIAVGAVLQSDGKIVVAGISTSSPGSFVLARYTTAGALDPTFGIGGRVITYSNDPGMEAGSIALDGQGRIIVLGFAGRSALERFTVARFASNGTLDSTFGSGGLDRISSGPALNNADAVAVESDGKIVVAGGTASGDFYATRLTSAGALDTTFGTSGFADVSFGNNARAQAINFASRGTIVLGGTGLNAGSPFGTFDLTRLNFNGTLDTTFGSAGKTSASIGTPVNFYAMTTELDGKIIVVGGGVIPAPSNDVTSMIARYTTAGKLDTTFAGVGYRQFNAVGPGVGSLSDANAVAVQVDGKILVAGHEGLTSGSLVLNYFYVTRFLGDTPGSLSGKVFNDANGNGVPDPGEAGLSVRQVYLDINNDGVFDAGDYYVNTNSAGNFTFNNLALGVYRIRETVPAGYQLTSPGGASWTVTLTGGGVTGLNFGNQATTAGVLDLSFGHLGTIIPTIPGGPISTQSIAELIKHDGKSIVVGGIGPASFNPPPPGTADFALERYTVAGTLDMSYGNKGLVRTSFPEGDVSPTAAVLQPDGKVVVLGIDQTTSSHIILARYTTTGALDPTFGHGGIVVETPFANSYPSAMAIDGSARIIVGGLTTYNGGLDATVFRFASNGKLDWTFGQGGIDQINSGILVTPPRSSSSPTTVDSVAIESDGKIVIAGGTGAGDFYAARLTSTGALDTAFGVAGVADIGFGELSGAISLQFASGGQILLAGNVTSAAMVDSFALARLNANGSLDTTFGTKGKTTTSFPSDSADATAMAIQRDGKIILVGGAAIVNVNGYSFAITRYTANGFLDKSFNGTGQELYNTTISQLFGVNGTANAVAIQTDGRIVVAGTQGMSDSGGSGSNIILNRFFGDAPITFSGTVFKDANGNGILDPGEGGLGSRQIYLDLNDNGIFDSADYSVPTDRNGHYTFANLAPGTYFLREVLPAGVHLTAPASGVLAVTLTAGQSATGQNFGNSR